MNHADLVPYHDIDLSISAKGVEITVSIFLIKRRDINSLNAGFINDLCFMSK